MYRRRGFSSWSWAARSWVAVLPWLIVVPLGLGAAQSACSSAKGLPLVPDGGAPDPVEDCSVPGDEDGNGVADCMDPACARTPACLVTCGDGIQDRGEQCDDGNRTDGDACEADCTLPVCGNGITDPGEQCDDGNRTDGDSCESDCTLPVCGNGIKDPGEQCDDGNQLNNDACDIACTLPRCGNHVRDPGEQCDDGNRTDGDSCESDCTLPVCGNGITDPGEQCDDGNRADGDTCENLCVLPSCGNGIKDPGEQCDDGNTASGTCAGDCTLPRVPDCSDGKPALTITSPASGTTVVAGSDLPVTIEFCGVAPFEVNIDVGDSSVTLDDEQLFTSPFTVSLPVPASSIGRVSVLAFVIPEVGNIVFARTVGLNVNVDATLTSIFISNGDITLRPGWTQQVRPVGVYSDGVRREITHAPGTMYGASNGRQVVATVSNTGLLTAVSPGFAAVAVLNGTIRTSVSVTVNTPVCGDGFLDPGEQCDDRNTDDGDGCDSRCQLEPAPVSGQPRGLAP